jgi:hypothetical protein
MAFNFKADIFVKPGVVELAELRLMTIFKVLVGTKDWFCLEPFRVSSELVGEYDIAPAAPSSPMNLGPNPSGQVCT